MIEFNAPLIVAAPTYNIIDELKAEGDWAVLQKYSGFEFDDSSPKDLLELNTRIFYILKGLAVIYAWEIKKKLQKVIL